MNKSGNGTKKNIGIEVITIVKAWNSMNEPPKENCECWLLDDCDYIEPGGFDVEFNMFYPDNDAWYIGWKPYNGESLEEMYKMEDNQ